MRPFFFMTKKSRQEFKNLENKKRFYRAFSCQNCLSAPLNRFHMVIDFNGSKFNSVPSRKDDFISKQSILQWKKCPHPKFF